jgi:hypothetical protein
VEVRIELAGMPRFENHQAQWWRCFEDPQEGRQISVDGGLQWEITSPKVLICQLWFYRLGYSVTAGTNHQWYKD